MRISDWSSDVCSSDLCESAGDCWRGCCFQRAVAIRSSPGCAAHRWPRALGCAEWQGADDTDRWMPRQRRSARGSLFGEGLREAREDDLPPARRSEEHTSELQSLMRISYAVSCLTKNSQPMPHNQNAAPISHQLP